VTPQKPKAVNRFASEKSRPVEANSDALQRGRLAKTKDGRYEETAYFKHSNARIYVTTAWSKTWGVAADPEMTKLVEAYPNR